MRHLLNQPYPCEDSLRRRWIKAFWIGVFVGLFLLIFQPFGLTLWDTPYKTAKILGFGLISFLVTAFVTVVTPVLFPKRFTNEHWTVGREILWITIHITLIGVANYLYLHWQLRTSAYSPDLPGMLLVTFVIGVFPATGLVVVNYIIRLKKYSQSARELAVREHPEKTAPIEAEKPRLTVTAENEKDRLSLLASDLLYIESSDNYSTVVYLKDRQPVKTLLRSSLSRLETQLHAHPTPHSPVPVHPTIVRCHRSFIVNLENVEKVTGNAQGYKLHLHHGLFQIPVARKYNDTLVAHLKALT
ncbi:LytR/AlgR family response regulator transcription factor [Larkinella bovis]|uniref:LytR/AlgR family response regulator transcription factor n=1 Tax=Larkinella bovis TaxID=683041 RepID=A0ABW0IJJ5_9BACT